MTKIHCPFHDDSTASMEIYPDGKGYCFGCSKVASIEELSLDKVPTPKIKKKEDVHATLEYISKLPRKVIRGLELPHDDSGFYIVYPGELYYNKRLWDPEAKSKYICPSGTPRPLYAASPSQRKDLLFVVEGELNAASLATVFYSYNVVSPGSATEFDKQLLVKYCLQYATICLIVDEDAPGVVAALGLKKILLEHGKRVAIYPMPEDLNSLLVKYGPAEVRSQGEKALAMLAPRVQERR